MAKFFNTYFRIDAGYVWGEGMNPTLMRRFYDEITLLFVNAGWNIEHASSYSSCIYVIKGKTKLYVHPMELSGACDESLIPDVTALLQQGESWKLRCVDKFDELLDLTEDELMEYYRKDSQKADRMILKAFVKGKEKHDVNFTLFDLGEQIKVKTLTDYIGRSSLDVDQKFLRERFDALVDEGFILSDGNTAHTLTEEELKARKTEPCIF